MWALSKEFEDPNQWSQHRGRVVRRVEIGVRRRGSSYRVDHVVVLRNQAARDPLISDITDDDSRALKLLCRKGTPGSPGENRDRVAVVDEGSGDRGPGTQHQDPSLHRHNPTVRWMAHRNCQNTIRGRPPRGLVSVHFLAVVRPKYD